MANSGPSGNPLADFVTAILQLVFHLLFPLIVVSLCGVSYVLAIWFHMPEFGFWFGVAVLGIDAAKTNMWIAIGVGLFVLAALPLAYVAYREQQLQISKIFLQAIIAVGVIFGMFWLRTNWPYENSGWQLITYGIIMFAGWAAVTEATLGILAITAHTQRSRPRPTKPPPQAPHGSPRDDRRRSSDEPETI